VSHSGLDLFFVAEAEDGTEVPLVPGGENIRVTDGNKERWLRLWVRYTMGGSVRDAMASVREGFKELCPVSCEDLPFFLSLPHLLLPLLLTRYRFSQLADWLTGSLADCLSACLLVWTGGDDRRLHCTGAAIALLWDADRRLERNARGHTIRPR
jgi:hypothetical protein